MDKFNYLGKSITVRFTGNQALLISDRAIFENLKPSAFIRKTVLDYIIRVETPAELEKNGENGGINENGEKNGENKDFEADTNGV